MAENTDNIITLTDEEGAETSFELLDVIESDDRVFIVLFPVEEGNEGDVVILELEDSDNLEQETYVSVEDEEILMRVFNVFKEKHKDRFVFKDAEAE